MKVVYVIRAWKNQDLYVEHHADGMSINILCEDTSGQHMVRLLTRISSNSCSEEVEGTAVLMP